MHETPTSQNSPEKPNSIQITHKGISIFPLHVRHDKVSLSKQMTISRGFQNYHWEMPRPMIENSPFPRRMKGSWSVSFCQSYFMKSKQYVSVIAHSENQTLTRKASDRENLQCPHHFGRLSENNFRMTGKQNSFHRFSF